jgi:hypothetical protein
MLTWRIAPTQVVDGAAQWRRLGLAFTACAALSVARAALAATLRVDESGLSMLTQSLFNLSFAALGGLAGIAYMRALRVLPDPASALAGPRRGPTLEQILVGSVLLQILASLALPLTSNDVFSNLAYGHLAAHGYNPYLVGPGAMPADAFSAMVGERWLNTPIAYGPVLARLSQLAVTGSLLTSLVSFKLLMLCVSIAVVLTAYGYCRSCLDGERARQSFLLIAWNPLLIWEIAGQAHNDGVMVLALMGFVWAASRQREVAAVVLLVLAVCAKYAAGAVLGLYLVFLFRRAPLRAVALGLVAAGLSVLLMLPYWTGSSSLQGPAATLGGDPTRVAGSLAGFVVYLAGSFGPSAAQRIYLLCLIGGTALLVLVFAYALLRTRTLEDVFHYSLVTLLLYCLVATPWFQPWYATWFLPLAVAHRSLRWQQLSSAYSALVLIEYAPSSSLWAAGINPLVLGWMLKARRSQRA